MLVETTVDVSTDIQIVENLENQFFVLVEDAPNKGLDIKTGKENDAKIYFESSNSDLEFKEKSLGSKEVISM